MRASEQDVAQYRRDGAICLRGVLGPALIDLLRDGIEHNRAHLSCRGNIASTEDDPGRFVEDFCTWQENDAYRRFIFDSGLAELAAQLMGSDIARLYHDHMLVKEPGTRQRTPWHQDQPYYNIDGAMNVSFWIPVDPVSRASCVEYVAGTHKGPWLVPRSFRDNQAKWFPEGSLADLPDIDSSRDAYDILGWDMQPGDLIAFHMLTLHGSAGVAPGAMRRAFSVRFLGDDIVHAPRPWPSSPSFPGLEDEIPAGAPMEHPLFPILWPR